MPTADIGNLVATFNSGFKMVDITGGFYLDGRYARPLKDGQASLVIDQRGPALSLMPFLAGLMRYSLLVAQGDGEAPEDVITSDRFFLVSGAMWAATAGCAIHLA